MLTQGGSVEAHALRQRGWTVSAIARHLDKDRKTVRYAARGVIHLMPTSGLCRTADGRIAICPVQAR